MKVNAKLLKKMDSGSHFIKACKRSKLRVLTLQQHSAGVCVCEGGVVGDDMVIYLFIYIFIFVHYTDGRAADSVRIRQKCN